MATMGKLSVCVADWETLFVMMLPWLLQPLHAARRG
jgi:hypothetical protein